MDTVSRDLLARLAQAEPRRAVSFFLPTHRAGPDSRPFAAEDVIGWKNLLREAATALAETGAPARDIDTLLEPARALLDNEKFWQYQSDGLAVFVAPGTIEILRVPIRVEPQVIVSRRFHVRPLLPFVSADDVFFLLALSQHSVRLFRGDRERLAPVPVPGAPANLDDAVRLDVPERQLQFRTRTAPRSGGRRQAMFHGHGIGVDDTKEHVLQFCQQVDAAVAAALRGERAPLLVAAVEFVAAIYRQANTYPHLLDRVLTGNPEGANPRDLHGRAWPLVEPDLLQARQAALDKFRRLSGSGRTTTDLRTTLPAAASGQVEVLFVANGTACWGQTDASGQPTTIHEQAQPGDEDLVDAAAARTILAGGDVYAVGADELPGKTPVAALLRY
jgi:hypothetical protein